MDIAAWLEGLGLGQYGQAFRDNEVDERVLPSLTAEDLKDLGVLLVGHNHRTLHVGNRVAAGEGPPTAYRPYREHPGQLGCFADDLQEKLDT
jgi:SAM (Sterile alpha motif) domain-containing protein